MLNKFKPIYALSISKKSHKNNKVFFRKYIKKLNFKIFIAFFQRFRLIINDIKYKLKKIKSFANFCIIYANITL